MFDAVALGDFQALDQARRDCFFVGRVHRVAAGDHHDDVRREAETFDIADHIVQVVRVSSWEDGDLRAIYGDARGRLEILEFGGDEQSAIFAAGHLAIFVGNESSDEFDVGRHDAELNIGFESDATSHVVYEKGWFIRRRQPSRSLPDLGSLFNSEGDLPKSLRR